jgi:hypothetical protein
MGWLGASCSSCVHKVGPVDHAKLIVALVFRKRIGSESVDRPVRDWRNGRSTPTGSRADRLIELSAMTDRLVRVMDPGYIQVWLNRLEVLDDDKPVEVIARGDYRRVAQLIADLEYPGVS